MACAFLLQLLHDALQLFLLLIQFLLVAGDSLLQAGEGRGWILHLDKGRNIGLCGAVVLDGHVHGQLMGRLQRQLCVAQVAFSTVCGVISLDAQEVDLVNQRLADAVGKDRALHQVVEGRLRHARQQLFLVDGFGQLFGEAAQASECAARINMQDGLGEASEVRQQFVAGAEKLEVD
ncbi:hypothetical protein FQZ97_727730 [compost metagenome]